VRDPFRASIAGDCASISERTHAAAVVPIRLSARAVAALSVAALLTIAASLAPRAGEAERRLMAEEAGRLRAVASTMGVWESAEAAEMRERLSTLADALASGRLELGELARAAAEARAALERARRRERADAKPNPSGLAFAMSTRETLSLSVGFPALEYAPSRH
jgi:hypothetical protein